MIIIKTTNGDYFINENEIHIVQHDREQRLAVIRSAMDDLNCIIHDVDAIIYTNEAYTTATESDTDSQPEQQPDYASDGIARLWEEMDRLEKLARDERRKKRPDLSNTQTGGNATRFCSKCRSNGIETIGDLLKKGRTHILQLSGIGVNCAKLADTALKNLYGIENW